MKATKVISVGKIRAFRTLSVPAYLLCEYAFLCNWCAEAISDGTEMI